MVVEPLTRSAEQDRWTAFIAYRTYVNARPRPLALYWFGRDAGRRDAVLARTVTGGVTINDCLFHVAHGGLPFAGVGASATGAITPLTDSRPSAI